MVHRVDAILDGSFRWVKKGKGTVLKINQETSLGKAIVTLAGNGS